MREAREAENQGEAEAGPGGGGRGTGVSRWRTQVDQTDRKAGSRDGRQRRWGRGRATGRSYSDRTEAKNANIPNASSETVPENQGKHLLESQNNQDIICIAERAVICRLVELIYEAER